MTAQQHGGRLYLYQYTGVLMQASLMIVVSRGFLTDNPRRLLDLRVMMICPLVMMIAMMMMVVALMMM
jgi:hypothetical protein